MCHSCLLFYLWLSFVLLVALPVPAEELKVVTWNVQWFPGRQPGASQKQAAQHLLRVRQVIQEIKPDILLLQEVMDPDAVKELCESVPDLESVVVSDVPGRQELVIASTLKPLATWSERWAKAEPHDPPRGFAFAALELSEGRLLLAYNIHLKANIGDPVVIREKRENAMDQLLAHVERMKSSFPQHELGGIIIAGDFNMGPELSQRVKYERTIKLLLKAGYQWSGEGIELESRITLPGSKHHRDASFDHVFSKGLNVLSHRVLPIDEASDHYPVVVVLERGQ